MINESDACLSRKRINDLHSINDLTSVHVFAVEPVATTCNGRLQNHRLVERQASCLMKI